MNNTQMAEKAGFDLLRDGDIAFEGVLCTEELQAFASLVLEEAALVAEGGPVYFMQEHIATSIRAMKGKP